MSTQEERFAQIAAAIREKDGTTGPIKALDFAARIRAIPIGSGASDFAIPLVVTVDAGATVTAAHGETTVTATSGADGTAALILTAPGIWRVTADLGDKEKSTEIEVIDGYTAEFMLSSRLPVGYTELEYIHWEGTHTSYILLENIHGFTDRISCKFYFDNVELSSLSTSSADVFIACSKYSSSYYFISLSIKKDKMLYSSLGGSSTNAGIVVAGTLFSFDLDFKNGKFTANGQELKGTRRNFEIGIVYKNIGGAPASDRYSAPGKFYSFKQYRNDEIIHEYVPCINADGVCGIFDINTENFITNTHKTPTPVTPGPAV